MKKYITILCCIAIIGVFSLVPNFTERVDAKNNNSDIIGTWVYYDELRGSHAGAGFSKPLHSLQFTEDGQLRVFDGDNREKITIYNYSYDNKNNTITFGGENTKVDCFVEGNGMYIKNGSMFTGYSGFYELDYGIFIRA